MTTPMFHKIAPEAASLPLYRSVKRTLLRVIEEGGLPPAAALPSETELSALLGVSVGTLRRAVDELVAEHILVRRQGRRTFVASHDAARFLFQFFRVERSDGLREVPQVELIAFDRMRLQDDDAVAALRLKLGERARALGAERVPARVLGLAPGLPVLEVRRTALTFGDKSVEYRISTVHTRSHDYVQTLSRPIQTPVDR